MRPTPYYMSTVAARLQGRDVLIDVVYSTRNKANQLTATYDIPCGGPYDKDADQVYAVFFLGM
jgi:hypothetical protein